MPNPPVLTPQQQAAFDALAANFPARYRVRGTTYLKGLLEALAMGDAYINSQVEAVRDNSLVLTASGKHLDRLASQYGIVRGVGTGVQDSDFRQLVPILGMSPKQINHSLQKVIDVIYGPYASHANITCSAPAPYALAEGKTLRVMVDGEEVVIYLRATDAVNISSSSAQELAAAITEHSSGRVVGSVVSNTRTGENFVNIRSATIGPQGFIQVLGGDAQAAMRFPEIRPARQTMGSWTVSRYQGTDEMFFQENVPAQSPALRAAGVRIGDFVTIRSDSGFNIRNVGTFEVTFVEEDSFRCKNGNGVPESNIPNIHVDDFVFYRSNTGNILLSARPATVIQTGLKELTIVLPVTSPIVKRTLKGGHHFHGAAAVVTATGSGTTTLGSGHGFPDSGSIHVISSRLPAEGTCSTTLADTLTLISAEGWPQSGAAYSPTTQTYYYYSSLTGDTLHGVVPTPPATLAGAPLKYSERYLYTGKQDNVLTGVYPDATPALGLEVSCQVELQGPFVGSFLYDLQAPYISASLSTNLSEIIKQGSSRTVVQVGDISAWPDQGYFSLEPSTKEQEGPIKYLGKVGTKALIIDPGHVFKRDHLPGSVIRLIRRENLGPYIPRVTGEDYPVYMTGTSQARTLLLQYLQDIVAAGITLKFQVQIPDEKWPVSAQLYSNLPNSPDTV